MSSQLIFIILIIISHLIAGGIVSIVIGKKINRFGLKRLGIVSIIIGVIALITFFVGNWLQNSFLVALIFIFLPLGIIAGLTTWLIYSIILIVNGFTQHKVNKIIIGFVLLVTNIAAVVVPILYLTVFGLPIAFM